VKIRSATFLIVFGFVLIFNSCTVSVAGENQILSKATKIEKETQAMFSNITLPPTTISPQVTITKTPIPPSPTYTPTPPTLPDLSGELLWFAPNFSRHLPENPDQRNECWDLFMPEAPWPQAKEHVDVIQIDQLALSSYQIEDNDEISGFPLPDAIESIHETGLLLSIQVIGPGNGVCSGEEAAARDLSELEKIPEAGGEINFIVIPEPFEQMVSHGHENNCRFTFEEAAEQLSIYIIALRTQFPKVKFGIYEPLRKYSMGNSPHFEGSHHYGEFDLIFDRVFDVLESHDESIDYFHMYSPNDMELFFPQYAAWVYGKIIGIGDYLRSRGIRYGVIYFSQQGGEESDARFFEDILHMKELIIRSNRDHDDYVLQSFLEIPNKCLPEDEPYTYTNLINEFGRLSSAPTITPWATYDNVWKVDDWCENHVGCERLEVKNQSDYWINIVLGARDFWGATKVFSIPPRGHDWIILKPGRYDYTITTCGGKVVYEGDHALSGRWYLRFKQKWCE
jgi:hypothetical protein